METGGGNSLKGCNLMNEYVLEGYPLWQARKETLLPLSRYAVSVILSPFVSIS